MTVDVHELPIAAVIVESDGTVVAANQRAADLLGQSVDELVGRDLDPAVEAAPARHVETLADDDRTGPRLVLLRDASHERRLSAIVDSVADSTLVIDRDGLVSWQSARLASRIPNGVEALGVNPVERIHPEDLPKTLESLGQALADPTYRTRYTVRSRSPEEDDLWQVIEISGVSRIDDPDLEGIVVQVRNLDEGEALASLGEADGQFQSLADAAPIGIVVADARGRTVFRNSVARQLLQQGPDLHSGMEWRDAARPEERAELDAMVRDALAGHERETTARFDAGADRPLWLRVKVVPQRASGSTPGAAADVVGAIVMLEDVTAEVEAREETARLTHMLDATADYVAVWRPTGEILYVNTATRDALKRLHASGSAGRLSDLIDDEPRQAFVADALATLEDADTWRGELPLNIGPGETIPVSAIGVVRRGNDGEIDWIAMLARDISDLKAAEARLRELATRDSLTGLANRELFNDRLEQAAARQRRHGRGLAVLFCDLDGFKPVNDEHGHAAGDSVLVETARRLERVTREADTVARVGGDEFVIICEGITDRRELGELAERIIAVVTEPVQLSSSAEVRIGISIGLAHVSDTTRDVDPDRLLSSADSAMYRAKARGGNGYRSVAYRDVDGSQG